MTFKEWLPVTRRNRVALVFAGFSLVLFVVWNCVPVDPDEFSGNGVFGIAVWSWALDYRTYVDVFKSHDWLSCLAAVANLSLFVASAMVLLTIPMWRFFHASRILKNLLAAIILAGGLLIWFMSIALIFIEEPGSGTVAFTLISVQMILISSALFIFENELNWIPRRLDPRVPRRKI